VAGIDISDCAEGMLCYSSGLAGKKSVCMQHIKHQWTENLMPYKIKTLLIANRHMWPLGSNSSMTLYLKLQELGDSSSKTDTSIYLSQEKISDMYSCIYQ
ncbi:hypothetical protein ACJX0J_031445, partial [Zea mays]